MLYQRPSFTCPAASQNTKQVNWDLAFLTKSEFLKKYPALTSWYEQNVSIAQ